MGDLRLTYCPRCGGIGGNFAGECAICHWKDIKYIDPEWNITYEAYDKIRENIRACGELTEEEYDIRREDYYRPFLENVVMTGPYFTPDAYKLYMERHFTSKPKEVRQKYVDNMLEVYKKIQSVECPFCGSSNTKKIPHVLRMFGLSSKWWRCKNCKSVW